MKKNLSMLFIIIGVLMVLFPLLGKLYNHYQQEKFLEEWVDEGDMTDDEDYVMEPSVIVTDTPDSDNSNDAEKETEKISVAKPAYKPNIIGTIQISKINVNIPIVEGTTQQDLKYGAGHLKGTGKLGQVGNCALAGHRSYTFGKMFNRLDEISAGDEIIVNTKQNKYKYVVYDKKVIEPDDFSVLKYGKGEKILTLVTCDPIFIADHRLIVQAKLME